MTNSLSAFALIIFAATSASAKEDIVFRIDCTFDRGTSFADTKMFSEVFKTSTTSTHAPAKVAKVRGALLYEMPTDVGVRQFVGNIYAKGQFSTVTTVFADGQSVRTTLHYGTEGSPLKVTAEIGQCEVVE
ncbi:hypothetical protein [uncultured Sulfitobacter sp.]|uniref:hypothetical protein n=1 Tax=uncultured Sulfitobacter sp. TaxID=191468 RepID=UPI0026204ABF|nr:hypothetical protein [uncultured Sulfitobacter sp.]